MTKPVDGQQMSMETRNIPTRIQTSPKKLVQPVRNLIFPGERQNATDEPGEKNLSQISNADTDQDFVNCSTGIS